MMSKNVIVRLITVEMAVVAIITNVFIYIAFMVLRSGLIDEIGLGWFNFFIVVLTIYSVFVFWVAIVWKITIKDEDDHLRFRNFFAQTNLIYFADIEKIEFKKNIFKPTQISVIILYSKSEEKLLRVSIHHKGFDDFIAFLKENFDMSEE